jgi:hypothetical protein
MLPWTIDGKDSPRVAEADQRCRHEEEPQGEFVILTWIVTPDGHRNHVD